MCRQQVTQRIRMFIAWVWQDTGFLCPSRNDEQLFVIKNITDTIVKRDFHQYYLIANYLIAPIPKVVMLWITVSFNILSYTWNNYLIMIGQEKCNYFVILCKNVQFRAIIISKLISQSKCRRLYDNDEGMNCPCTLALSQSNKPIKKPKILWQRWRHFELSVHAWIVTLSLSSFDFSPTFFL